MAANPVVEILRDGQVLANGTIVPTLIGQEQVITFRFDNQSNGASGSSVGYAPYLDILLPRNGADGSGIGDTPANDGISFIAATYLGQPVSATVLEFDAQGHAAHPFAKQADGSALVVTGTPGDALLVLNLPFGSFTDPQTPADIAVRLGVSGGADLGIPLNLSATGGFAYGRDPLNNPSVDSPVRGPTATVSLDPQIAQVDVVYVGPEQETATGPSYPHSWLVQGLIAPGQSLTGFTLSDDLPDGIVLLGASIVNGTGTVTVSADGRHVSAQFDGTVTGGGAPPTLRIDYYVGATLTDGSPVLDPATGAFRVMRDQAQLSGTWTPSDARDPVTLVALDPAGPEDVITAKSIAVQKYVSVVDAAEPGGHLQWRLEGQVSNYFEVDQLLLTDSLGDGQHFDGGFQPILTVRENGVTVYSGAMTQYTVARDAVTGVSTLRFDVSAELRAHGLDDALQGGGAGNPNPATAVVSFRSVVERAWTGPVPADGLVDQGDLLDNSVVFSGQVAVTDRPIADGSMAAVTLPVSTVEKSIYAINGVISPASTQIVAGDEITFRLKLDLPLTSAHQVRLTDFLPLPVLLAGDADANSATAASFAFVNSVSGTPPAVGIASFGPTDSFHNSGDRSVAPTVTWNTAGNSLLFDFGDVDAGTYDASSIDLLFTVRVVDAPFGDGLLLTNQVTSTETNSAGAVSEDNAIIQFTLTEPTLSISKSVIATSNAHAVIADADGGAWSPAGVNWTAPGSMGNRFSGTLSSQALGAQALDANVTGVDAGDVVSFALIVENSGSGLNGAFDLLLRDVLPSGFAIPDGGVNLRVTDGAGRSLAYTLEGGGLFGTDGGLRLTDPGLRDGGVDAYDATSGRNIVVVTYDLLLASNPDGTAVQPGSTYLNGASILNYAALEGGINRVPSSLAADMADGATIATAGPTITKAVVTTSSALTGTARGDAAVTDLAIGETVTYGLTIRLSEGLSRDLRVQDLLPNTNGDLEFVSARIVSIGGNLSGINTSATPAITDRDSDGVQDTVSFTLGDVLNRADNLENANDLLTIEVVARARNMTSNSAGDLLTNTATVSVADGDEAGKRVTASGSVNVELVEPSLSIDKSVNRTSADAGDVLTYTVKVSNANGTYAASALDLVLTDLLSTLPPNAGFRPGSVTVAGTGATASIVTGNGSTDTGLRVDLSRLDPGETLTVTFQAAVSSTIAAGTTVSGNASVTGTSLPGADTAERSYTVSDGASFTVPRPSVVKSVVATDAADTGTARYTSLTDLKIGETATFEITVTLPEGSSPSFRVTDLLPDTLVTGTGGRLAYVDGSAVLVSTGGNLSMAGGGAVGTPVVTLGDSNGNGTADRIVLSFGDLVNAADNVANAADRVTIRLQAKVVDAVSNENGDTLTNTAYAEANGLAGTSTTAKVEIVEPRLTIDKASSVVAGTALDAGAEITYTLTVRHASTSQLNAYDLLVQDQLPGGLDFIAGSLSVSAGTATITNGAIAVSLAQLALDGSPLTITYRAKVADAVTPGQVLSNTASLSYDNLAGTGGRAGPVVQDTETRTVVLSPTLAKTVAATSDAGTGSSYFNAALPDLAIGETVTFRLLATLGEGTQRVVLSDTLPVGMMLLGASLESVGANLRGLATPVATTSGQVTRLDFGTVTNLSDNLRDGGDQFSVLVTARVTGPALTAGSVLVNTAQIDTSGPGGAGLLSGTASASAEVVRPLLLVDKTTPVVVGNGADIVTYSVVIKHATGSTAPAYNLQLDDALAPGLVLVAGSATTTSGTVTSASGELRLTLDSLAIGAAPVVVTYQARLADGVVNGQAITNTAALRYDTAPTSGTSLTASDPATVTVSLVNTVDKVLFATDNAATSGSDVAPGELVTWRITATLAEGAQAITLSDLLPTGLDYVASQVVSLGRLGGSSLAVGASGTWDAAARKVGFDFGTLLNAGDNQVTAGDTLVVEVQARVGTAPAHGALLTNGATLTAFVPANVYGVTPGTTYGSASDTDTVRDVEARLGGNVFVDVNGNGLQDAGEGGLAGVAVRLLDAAGNDTGRAATTDASGQYLFSDLVPGTYAVAFGRPAAQQFTLANIGANDAVDSDADRATGRTASIILAAGADDRSLDAGLYVPASIGDRVFHDLNANGIQDGGEPGLAGITLRLIDAVGNTVATRTTDGSGAYLFGDLIPGSYRIASDAAGWLLSPLDRGSNDATDSDFDPVGRISAPFALTSGAQVTSLDLGLWRTASLGDRVFLDRNANGIQDAEDTGIAGLRVTLLDASGMATGQTTTTDANGNYLFPSLVPGTYRIRFDTPSQAHASPRDVGSDLTDSDIDATGTTGSITLSSAEAARNTDAGFWYDTRIGDRAWEDLNGNGLQDAGEPGLGGVVARLLNVGGQEVARTVTAADGSYLFAGYPSGSYSLQFQAPAGYVATRADAGGNDALDSDALANGGTVVFVNAGPDSSRDAGFYRPVTVGGDVWLDVNGNGVHDAGEQALPGVPVRLLDALGQPLGPSTVTDATGAYSFTGLAPGSYRTGFAPLIGTAFAPQDQGGSEALDSDATAVNGISSLVVTLTSGGSSLLSTAGLVLDLSQTPVTAPTLLLGNGNNGFPGTANPERVYGEGGDDSLNGLGGNDTLFGGDGNDTLNGHDGNDTLWGGRGNDNVQGQSGNDVIIGGEGDDIGEGGDGNDVLIAGPGRDNMQGEGGDDLLFGGSGDDILTGNQGNDLVAGGSGNDRLSGADGADIVIGGRDDGRISLDQQGNLTGIIIGDMLEGNSGADAFVWQAGDGVDLLLDLNPAEGDTLTIYGYNSFAAIQRTQDGRMALYLGPDSAIILNNGLFQGAKPDDTLPGVRFVATTANAPGDLVGSDAVVPVLAQNWVSTFSGAGAIAIAQAFPPADPPTSQPNLADVAFDHFIQASGSNDRIALEAGNSWIEAGAGFDVVSVAGGFRGTETSLIDDGSLRLDLRSQTALLRNVEEVDFVDGRLHLSVDSAAAQVSRLYDAALGREPEQAGLNFWIDRLEAGQPLLTLANGFLDSAEFGYRYGHPSNQDYVALLYQNVLGRAPDPGGEATWTAALAAGTSRASVLIGFSESPENKRAHAAEDAVGIWDVDENAAFVALLYDAALNRLPDVSGLASWRAALDAGQFTKATMTAAFTESGEYRALYGGLGNQQFVQALYINALNRPADPGGLATWTGLLDKGVSRAEVIQAISESAEHVAITKPFIMSDAPDHFGIAFA
ncbi:SdrD B-like domain-containing protein [Roseomonas gilardii]|uniref:SdrD B-like domain-containing protein n=1 Tax=Roseomonas gilardii TaxID=257708 RepID=A0ABU3MME7_9PROT|nr:SdrD B-like domain-containing protein [Roseomonas gilardii]MDT8333626.1 SdrD B-like domain-containing protein [Roseomonas gilardii]